MVLSLQYLSASDMFGYTCCCIRFILGKCFITTSQKNDTSCSGYCKYRLLYEYFHDLLGNTCLLLRFHLRTVLGLFFLNRCGIWYFGCVGDIFRLWFFYQNLFINRKDDCRIRRRNRCFRYNLFRDFRFRFRRRLWHRLGLRYGFRLR